MAALLGLGIAGFIGWKLIIKPCWMLVSPANARRSMPGIFGPPARLRYLPDRQRLRRSQAKEQKIGMLQKFHDFVFVRNIG